MQIVAVTMAIMLGSHMAQGTDSRTVYFNTFPSFDDVLSNAGEDKFQELVKASEVEEFADYLADFEANEGFINFECHDTGGSHIGTILIERHDVQESSCTE